MCVRRCVCGNVVVNFSEREGCVCVGWGDVVVILVNGFRGGVV